MSHVTCIRNFLLFALLGCSTQIIAQTNDDFLAMRDAFRASDTRKLDLYAPKLKGHVLEPYAAYWQLRARLNDAPAETVRAFLAEYKDTFVAERLRSDWVKRLGKTQQWDLFAVEQPLLVEDDIDVTCLALQARSRTDATAVREARSLWFTEKDTPESCAPLFNALAASNQLSAQDVWARVRMALAVGQVGVASRAAAYLPAGQAPNAALLSAVSQNPAAHLARPLDTSSRAARETTMFAAYRLARSSPQQAAAHWAGMESKFTEDERAFVWGHIGLQGALRHDPQTLAWYAKAGDMNDYQLEWKARAALRVSDWKTLIAAGGRLQGTPPRRMLSTTIFRGSAHPEVWPRPEARMQYSGPARLDRKSTRLNSSHIPLSRMPSSA